MEGPASWLAAVLMVLSMHPQVASAQASYGAEERGIERVKGAMELESVKIDGAFGEVWAPYNGTVAFSVADVALSGNNEIPVEFRRSTTIRERRGWYPADARMSDEFGGMDDWNVDLPMIYGMFAKSIGWQTADANSYARCSIPLGPKSGSTLQKASDFWNGYRLNIPGNSNKTLLDIRSTANLIRPQTGRSYTLGTKDFWMVSCLPSTKNGYPGEGFLVESPTGLRYYMDWVITKSASTSVTYSASRSPLVPQKNPMERSLVYFMVSRIEDRFGNFVNFSFNGSNVTRIESSDGRWISIGYSGNRVSTVDSVRGRWTYAYTANGMLSAVTRPDGSSWTYGSAGRLLSVSESMEYSDSGPPTCAFVPLVYGEDYSYNVKNPSGASARFSFKYIGLARNNVPKMCSKPAYTLEYWVIPPIEFSYALVDKTVTGPGLGVSTWGYAYQTGVQKWEEQCAARPEGCASEPRITTVTHPDRHQEVYEHGNAYNVNDGLLLKQQWIDGSGLLRELSNDYQLDGSGQSYPQRVGISRVAYTSLPAIEQLQPVKRRVITQSGDQYVREVQSFDAFARPQTTRRSSPLYSRTDTVQYADALGVWVLGQAASSINNDTGVVESRATYDGRGLPVSQWAFGNLLQEFTYHADGNVASVKDGRGNATLLGAWKLGVPQELTFADGTRKVFEVDARGDITSVTDQNGAATRYGYDAMGRVARIDYPAGDSIAWNATTQDFAQVAADEYGLGPGHWRKSIAQGNLRRLTYYDALLRPVVVREFDAANEDATRRFRRYAYDIEGRQIFASYPGQADAIGQGVSMAYDALGRVVGSVADSEVGDLVTLKEYMAGNQIRTVDPRGSVTVERSMALDVPDYQQVVRVEQPQGLLTEIERNVFGKPTAITRRDAAGTLALTRLYGYDSSQRLCNILEPESGATVHAYDASGNLAWTAAGLDASMAGACNRDAAYVSGRRVDRTYDALNRLSGLSFPDGQGNQVWTYTADGKPLMVQTTNGATIFSNVYAYNKRGLITGESFASQAGESYSLGYGYDGNGALAGIRYPSGMFVDYAPNALGQPTRAGDFATGVSYYPNGAIRAFSYGNGILHTMEQNQRQLPRRSVDSGVIDRSFAYDANGNTVSVREANPTASSLGSNRDLTYDALDRLIGADMDGRLIESFGYDALDNLISKGKVNSGQIESVTYTYDAGNRLTNVRNADGATVTGIAYDLQGNLRVKNGRQFQFDYGNRLRGVTDVASYQYDAYGRRVSSVDVDSGSELRSVYGQDGQLRMIADDRKGSATEYITLSGSLVARVTAGQAPRAPVLSAPATSDGNHVLAWTASRFATTYELQSSSAGADWVSIYSGSGMSFAVTSQPLGIASYRVRAGNGGVWGGWSAISTVSILAPAGSAPVISGDSEAPGGQVSISWTGVFNAQRYVLTQSSVGGAKQVAYDGVATSKDIEGLPPGVHGFSVQACDAAACSPGSAVLNVRAYYAPAAPGLSVPSVGYNGSYTVTWSAVADTTSYRLWESTDGSSWGLQQDDGALSRQYSGRASGNYWYRVEACNVVGCGTSSATGMVTVLYPPAAPQLNVPANNGDGNYYISWNAVGWATTYIVDERLNGGVWSRIHDEGSTSRLLTGRLSGNRGYRVAACNVAGCSGWSEEAVVRVAIIPPVPTGLVVTYIQPNPNRTDYTAFWTGVSGASFYAVRSNGNAGCSTSDTYCSSSVSGRPNPGGFQVKACNDFVCSDWSAAVIAEDMR